jgi:regulatory protein
VPDTEDRLQRALELGYRYLNRRDRTVGEMRRHLARQGVDRHTTDETIATLSEQGYLNDARFARLLAEDKRELEQWGRERIERTLLERGIDRALVDETLASMAPQREFERALEVLERRFPSLLADRRDRDRALGVLLRKGYDTELALDALRAYTR